MRRLSFIVILFFVFQGSQARSFGKYLKIEKDSTFVKTYRNSLIIRLYSGEKSHTLQLSDLNSNYSIKYLPNGYTNLGIGVNFRSFGLSLATKIPLWQMSEIRHGETSRFGIQSYIYTSRFSVDLLSSFLSGYYLVNSSEHISRFSRNIEYQRQDISSANIGVTVNYIFNNKRFSYRAAFSDTERQLKSAGSLLAGGSVISYQTHADSSLVPREIKSHFFSKSRDISKTGVIAFNATIGYAYSLIFFKNGIFTMSYVVGTGLQENTFDREVNEEINRWRFSINHTGRIGIGYRFNRYYLRFGIIRSTQYTNLRYNDLGIGNGTNFMQVSLGKRFDLKRKKQK